MQDKNNNNDREELFIQDLENADVEKLTAKQARELLKKYLERESDLKNQAEKIAEKVAEYKKSAEEYKDKWMRAAAEFDNYKKRTANVRNLSEEEGKNSIITKILPIGDNLERAYNMPIDEKTKEGIALLIKNFKEILEKEGITEINPVGEPFDPNFHEALMQCESEEEGDNGTVKEVFLKGYMSGEKVIRYAQVKVVC